MRRKPNSSKTFGGNDLVAVEMRHDGACCDPRFFANNNSRGIIPEVIRKNIKSQIRKAVSQVGAQLINTLSDRLKPDIFDKLDSGFKIDPIIEIGRRNGESVCRGLKFGLVGKIFFVIYYGFRPDKHRIKVIQLFFGNKKNPQSERTH